MCPGDSPESISKGSESDDISEELMEPYRFITDSLPLRAQRHFSKASLGKGEGAGYRVLVLWIIAAPVNWGIEMKD